ncbi:glycosyltransferase family 4 protein [Flavisolibacter nicotianae]|uniref:glycosyltransferase family 4 protein n=1 Tax=Flavisolibacter nicotianae TaxID=2364882 RepID=UPI000EAFE671|nr:glycosyltransferase family 4 protein [Flavisolibacter nicotianae]
MQTDKPARVLWFTNTPSLAAEMLNLPTIGGGWINSLEEKIGAVAQIELGVAFRHGQGALQKFSKNRTTYFAIPDNTSKKKLLADRHRNRLDNESLVNYCVQIVNEYKPDVINIFGTEDAFGLLIDKVNVPVVIHLQGILSVYELKWFSGNVSKSDLVRHSSLKSFLKAESLLHGYRYFQKAAERERKIFRLGRYFMGRTDWDKRVTQVLSPEARYFHSDEMLRKEFFRACWQKDAQKAKVFVSTIQANIYKGLETILEAAALLKKNNAFPYQWLVAGIPGDHVLVKIFEKKTGLKFSDVDVHFVGKLTAGDLVQTELNADLFIHPSHIDNSANSICEAMLLGMPVIATYAGGTGSLLVDNKEGLLVQDGDPYALAGAILELIKNPGFAADLGRNARKRALERHHPDAIVQNLLNIYASIGNVNIVKQKEALPVEDVAN